MRAHCLRRFQLGVYNVGLTPEGKEYLNYAESERIMVSTDNSHQVECVCSLHVFFCSTFTKSTATS